MDLGYARYTQSVLMWDECTRNRPEKPGVSDSQYQLSGCVGDQASFSRIFPLVNFTGGTFLKHSGRGAMLYRFARPLPFLLRLYSACWNRVVLAAK